MVSKYRNHKVTYAGIKFDSKKERDRYIDLKMLERAGVIEKLELQPVFKFEINGQPLKENKRGARQVTYKADFSYIENGVEIIEDVKSPATAAKESFKIKKALFETIYNKKLTIYI